MFSGSKSVPGLTVPAIVTVAAWMPSSRTPAAINVCAERRAAGVALRLTLHGTHRGDLHLGQFEDFPATGRTIQYVSHEFYRVKDGLVAEEWICSDMASLLRQLS